MYCSCSPQDVLLLILMDVNITRTWLGEDKPVVTCASLAVPRESVAGVTVTHVARLDTDKPWLLVDATLGTVM